jgi:DNA primase
MDVITLHQAGFDTAVAALGTALGDEQARLLSDYADEVVLCYDGDEAGRRATDRAIQVLKHTQLKVRVLSLAGAKDPDEFIAAFGASRFAQLLDGSGNTLEYALAAAKRGFNLEVEDGRAAYIRAALAVLAAQASPVERDIYAGRVAEETGVPKPTVLIQLDGVLRARRRRQAKEREKRIRGEGAAASLNVPYGAGGNRALGVAFAEQQLVAAVLKNPGDFLSPARRVAPEQMLSPAVAEAWREILALDAAGEYVELAALSARLPEKTLALLGRVLAQNYDIGFSARDVELFIGRILTAAVPDKKQMDDEQWRDWLNEQRRCKGGEGARPGAEAPRGDTFDPDNDIPF